MSTAHEADQIMHPEAPPLFKDMSEYYISIKNDVLRGFDENSAQEGLVENIFSPPVLMKIMMISQKEIAAGIAGERAAIFDGGHTFHRRMHK